MRWTRRHAILVCGLVATLTAAYFAPAAEVTSQAMKQSSSGNGVTKTTSRPLAGNELSVLAMRPRNGVGPQPSAGALFGSSMPTARTPIRLPIAQSPLPNAEPPRTPEPPAIPFRVLGSFDDDGHGGVFVEYQDQNLVAGVGDTVAGFRIDAIDEQRLTVTYLPLDRQQTIDLGGSATR